MEARVFQRVPFQAPRKFCLSEATPFVKPRETVLFQEKKFLLVPMKMKKKKKDHKDNKDSQGKKERKKKEKD